MSQVSCNQALRLDYAVDHFIQTVEFAAQDRTFPRRLRVQIGQSRTQDAVVQSATKQHRPPTTVRHPIAMTPTHTLDDLMKTKPPQMITHLARGQILGGLAQQGRPVLA